MKKSLSFMLALIMVLCMMPGVALAADNVATINGVGYPSIRAAVEAAQNGDTIVVSKSHTVDCSESELDMLQSGVYSVITVTDKNVTIDLNGKTVNAESPTNANVSLFILIASTGNGNLTLKDTAGGGAVICKENGSTVYGLMSVFNTTAFLTVESGHYELDYAADNLIHTAGSETVVINGGTFHLGNVGTGDNGKPWIFNANGSNQRHVIVNGGTFNDDINSQYWIFEAQMPNTKALIDNGDGTWTVVDAVAYVNAREWSSAWYTYHVGYTSLADAVDAVRENRTKTVSKKTYDSGTEDVGLVTDCTVRNTLTVKEDFKLMLNGKTIIWEGDDTAPIFTVEDGNTLTVADFTPVRSGYTFEGWYTDEARENPYDLATEGKIAGATSLYAKWNVAETAPAPAPKPASGRSGIDVEYNGGNSFSTSKSAVPTSVEIDGVEVPFSGNGSSFTVGCIDPNAKWVTVRWNSTSVTVKFTPDANVVCAEILIPKTGDMPFWAAVAAFFGF